MEGNHTPGPWTAVTDLDGDHGIYAGDVLIAITDGWQAGNSVHRSFEVDAANAHLMSAAPDLLAIVSELFNVVQFPKGDGIIRRHHIDAMRAAIQKAQPNA
jgi:hypothetical protein